MCIVPKIQGSDPTSSKLQQVEGPRIQRSSRPKAQDSKGPRILRVQRSNRSKGPLHRSKVPKAQPSKLCCVREGPWGFTESQFGGRGPGGLRAPLGNAPLRLRGQAACGRKTGRRNINQRRTQAMQLTETQKFPTSRTAVEKPIHTRSNPHTHTQNHKAIVAKLTENATSIQTREAIYTRKHRITKRSLQSKQRRHIHPDPNRNYNRLKMRLGPGVPNPWALVAFPE